MSKNSLGEHLSQPKMPIDDLKLPSQRSAKNVNDKSGRKEPAIGEKRRNKNAALRDRIQDQVKNQES